MRKQKQANNGCVGKLEVEGSAVQVEEGGVDFQIVPATRRQALDVVERGERRALGLQHVGAREHLLRHFLRRVRVLVSLKYFLIQGHLVRK